MSQLHAEPRVSVIIPSYNHERYLKNAIDSVLSQTFNDFELIISDDCSTDHSRMVIEQYKDERVRSFYQEKNLGPVDNVVFLVKQARGEFVALLNSDDSWHPEKLAKQIDLMDTDPSLGACFTWAELVDDAGQSITTGPEVQWSDVFKVDNRSQGEWLKHFFTKGNCICHPSMLIKKEVYQKIGFYNPALKQLPDFEFWIRLVKQFPIAIVQESLVYHLRNGENTSSLSEENTIRNLNELVFIFQTFFDGIDDKTFIDGFSDLFIKQSNSYSEQELICEKLMLLRECSFVSVCSNQVYSNLMMSYSMQPEVLETLSESYGVSVFDFYRHTGSTGFGSFYMSSINCQSNQQLPKRGLRLLHRVKKYVARFY